MGRWQIYEVAKDADGVDCYIKRGEIVRCKECTEWVDYKRQNCGRCEAHLMSTRADDFCSYGEREGE